MKNVPRRDRKKESFFIHGQYKKEGELQKKKTKKEIIIMGKKLKSIN